MTHKSQRIAELVEPFRGRDLDARYLAFFDCFNRQLYFEAHDVLEELWLSLKGGPNYAFHKGLIQLAGGFVHLQKGRLMPAAAVLKLAQTNLRGCPGIHDRLDVTAVLDMIQRELNVLEESQFKRNPLESESPPKLHLLQYTASRAQESD